MIKASDAEIKYITGALSSAVQFKTVSYPDQSQVQWSEFDNFHSFLEKTYPTVHQKLTKEVIGRANLLYCWAGSEPELLPILLTAHQDVVPVGDPGQWVYPPFSGEIDDKFVNGRGSFDVKIQIVAILGAVENLIKSGFTPKRSIYLGFGSNEEVGGDGADLITEVLASRKIHFQWVLDEGGAVMETLMRQIPFHTAVVGVAEKGRLNLKLSVTKHGGHSSTPDNPTSLGILARALGRIERHQMPCHLVEPMRWFFDAVGKHTKGLYSFIFSNIWLTRPIVFKIFKKNAQYAAFIRTTHAATMCSGSEAANVISDDSSAIVNFRLLGEDDDKMVLDWVRKVVKDDRVKLEVSGEFKLQSPVSPINCPEFENLQQIIAEVFPDTVAVPYFMSGGSDAKSYTGVSEHVYRFTPALMNFDELSRMHGYNERLSIENVGRALQFYESLIVKSC